MREKHLFSVAAAFRDGEFCAVVAQAVQGGPRYTYSVDPDCLREIFDSMPIPVPVVFSAVQNENIPALGDLFEFSMVSPCTTMALNKFPQLRPRPAEFTFGPLGLGDVETIVTHWPYSGLYEQNGVPLVTELIKSGPTMCARKNGVLACWMVTYQDNSIGMLHTMSDFRRSNLAQHVVFLLSQIHVERGFTPYCHVVVKNEASFSLFTRLGFVPAGNVSFIRSSVRKSRL